MDGGISKRETRAAVQSACVCGFSSSLSRSFSHKAADLTNETASLVQRVRRGEGRGAEAAAGGRMRSQNSIFIKARGLDVPDGSRWSGPNSSGLETTLASTRKVDFARASDLNGLHLSWGRYTTASFSSVGLGLPRGETCRHCRHCKGGLSAQPEAPLFATRWPWHDNVTG